MAAGFSQRSVLISSFQGSQSPGWSGESLEILLFSKLHLKAIKTLPLNSRTLNTPSTSTGPISGGLQWSPRPYLSWEVTWVCSLLEDEFVSAAVPALALCHACLEPDSGIRPAGTLSRGRTNRGFWLWGRVTAAAAPSCHHERDFEPAHATSLGWGQGHHSTRDTRAGASLVRLWSSSRGLISVLISRSEVSPLFWLPALPCGCCTPEDLNTLIPPCLPPVGTCPEGHSGLAQRDTQNEQLVLTRG